MDHLTENQANIVKKVRLVPIYDSASAHRVASICACLPNKNILLYFLKLTEVRRVLVKKH